MSALGRVYDVQARVVPNNLSEGFFGFISVSS